nr:CPBP family intramembrane metalloprotease [Candidatus Aenigmarchaeota archaeon]
MISGVDRYPTPRVVALVFVICTVLVVVVGSWVQLSAFLGFLPGLYITEWILILVPPLTFLRRRGVEVKKALGLERLRFKHVLLGVLGGVGSYFIFLEFFLLMEAVLGPYPAEFLEPIMKWFPTNWLEFIPWILGMAFSAGICEETLFRGFIQNGLERSWGPSKALVVASILFGVFHLDPWRSPAAVFIGLLAGYLLLRT